MNDQLNIKQAARFLKPRISKYCPKKPFAKQAGFMMLTHDEAFYGGALGGGKSEAVLMDAMQYLHIPGYAALVLRRTKTDLKQPGALLHRMTEWMQPWLASKEVRWSNEDSAFYFPTFHPDGKRAPDSQIVFGFIGLNSHAYMRYQGIELQYCAFDELCQHKETDYNYLHTRLRKCVCPIHTERDDNEDPIYHDECAQCQWAKAMPIKMRGTGNPDGIGMPWVKLKFKIEPDMTPEEAKEKGMTVKWLGKNSECPFVPSSYKDNPYLDNKDYERRMRKKLRPDMYDAYMNGSWGVVPNSKFKKRWIKNYSMQGNLLWMGPNQTGEILNMQTQVLKCFTTIDPAATSEEGPGDMDTHPTKVKAPSWSVICTWWLTVNYDLLWVDMVRLREEIPDVVAALFDVYNKWKPSEVIVEKNGVGSGVAQYADKMGMPIQGVHQWKDKVENATKAILKMKEGKIWVPWPRPMWYTEAENEIFTWQGNPAETDDIVDNLSAATNHVDWENASKKLHRYQRMAQYSVNNVPGAVFPTKLYNR